MSEIERVRLPELIVIPAGTKPHHCGCGMWTYFVRDGARTRIVSVGGTFYSTRAQREITVPGCRAPTATGPGMGFDHHIDCAEAEQHRKRTRTKAEQHADVATAEQLARTHGIKCTGAPGVNDCTGDAVVAITLGGRLFATPCSVHADKTTGAIKFAGRMKDSRAHALEEFLVARGADVAKQFVAKAAAIRQWHTDRGGVTVPATGHL